MDFFSEEGKQEWQDLDNGDADYEHHAPDCKSFSKARGKPFYIRGRKHWGPPALRDERNVMGFSNLRGTDAVKVRQGNKMALASLRRCKQLYDNGRYFSFEHPYGSWVWYIKIALELGREPGVFLAVFSNCCHGGKRRKWTALLTNNREIYEALHQPDCPHGEGESYQPYEHHGRIIFPTEEEAEYPMEMCERYARAAAEGFGLQRHVEVVFRMARQQEIEAALAKYHRCADRELKAKMTEAILELEDKLRPGDEQAHLEVLLSRGHYRGADIRLSVEHCGAKHLVIQHCAGSGVKC